MGPRPDHRPEVEKNVVSIMYLMESILRRSRRFMKIIPKEKSTEEVQIELLQPSMLTNQNYNEYIFNGGADYARNEARASIRVVCDYDLTKLKGGGGAMYSQAHNEFMSYIEQAQPFHVDIEDSRPYDFVQTTFFVGSNRVDCPIQAIKEIQKRVIPLCEISITPQDFRLSYGPINMPRLTGSSYDSVTGYTLSVSKKHESNIAAIMADLPSEVDPVEFLATHNWKAFDVRLTVRYNESHFQKYSKINANSTPTEFK